ncbi:MAG: hypothetical protein HYW47_06190 [Deltaproteobacteria bacterium]|nr:hypothetical protein [Deltaproteobacteria bacterium]
MENMRSGEKSFGIVFSIFFAIVALLPVLKGNNIKNWALVASIIFLVLAFFSPTLLKPLNYIWTKFGLLLHKITTPVLMGIIFFGVITPMAIFLKLLKKDIINLQWTEAQKSYWIERTPPGPKPETMKYQF